jgi:glycosyltransferase involved in cell wall biosynthesis
VHLAYVDARIENYRSEFISELGTQFERVSLMADFCGEQIDSSALQILHEKSLHIFSRKIVYFTSVYSSLLKERPDVILTGDLGLRTLLCIAYAKKHAIPIYAWARLTSWSERRTKLPRRLLRKVILMNVTGVFVNGKDGSDYLNSVHPTRTHLLYQSSAHSRLAESRKSIRDGNQTRWIFVGRLIEEKGLVKFLSKLATTDFHLRKKLHIDFVGVGELRDWLESFTLANKIDSEFHGNLTGNAIIELLDKSEFFFFPSLGDEWGLAVVEAINRGLPILGSTKAGAINELSTFGDFGIFFDPYSEDQIKEVISNALSIGLKELRQYSDESLRLALQLELQPRKMAQKMFAVIVLNRV